MNRTKIENVLMDMGVPAGIKGFNYIADAVEILDEHKGDISVTKELYPSIAKKEVQPHQKLKGQYVMPLTLQEAKREIIRRWKST